MRLKWSIKLVIILKNTIYIAKLSLSSSSSWAELAVFSISPADGLHNIAYGLHNIADGLHNIADGLHNIAVGMHSIPEKYCQAQFQPASSS